MKGAILPPDDRRRLTPIQKKQFEKGEAEAGWKKPKKSQFQEEEEESKRRLKDPKKAEKEKRL